MLHRSQIYYSLDFWLEMFIVCVLFREGEELFQFLFLETEIKNSWEAYFEDAKQKLGKSC